MTCRADFVVFFFFKQKTAYEMRISDWSSDVCSSDLLPLVKTGKVHALAHITGGGLLENIPRVLPKTLHAHIDADAWPQPRLMAFLQAQGHIEPEEMARTFNCGIGMAVVVAPDDAADVTAALEAAGETVHRIGHITQGAKGCPVAGGRSEERRGRKEGVRNVKNRG